MQTFTLGSVDVVHHIYQPIPHRYIYQYIEKSGGHNTALCCTTVWDKSLSVVFPALHYTTLAISVESEEAQYIRTYPIPLQNLQQSFPIDSIVGFPQIKK